MIALKMTASICNPCASGFVQKHGSTFHLLDHHFPIFSLSSSMSDLSEMDQTRRFLIKFKIFKPLWIAAYGFRVPAGFRPPEAFPRPLLPDSQDLPREQGRYLDETSGAQHSEMAGTSNGHGWLLQPAMSQVKLASSPRRNTTVLI